MSTKPLKSLCLEKLELGQIAGACEQLFPNPTAGLHSLPDDIHELGNYLDALVFGSFNDALIANQVLQQTAYIHKHSRESLETQEIILQILRRFDDQLPSYLASPECQRLDQGFLPFLLSERRRVSLDKQTLKEVPQSSIPGLRETFMRQLVFGQNILRLQKQKASLFRLFSKENLFFSRPLLPLSFKAPKGLHKLCREKMEKTKGQATILMESWDWDWSALLKDRSDQPILFIFPSVNTLFHCAQFPDLLHHLIDRRSILLSLDHYPAAQLKTQALSQQLNAPIELVSLNTRKPYLDQKALLKERLNALFSLDGKQRYHESDTCDALYRLGRNLLDTWTAERLGPSRFLAHSSLRRSRDWNDPHKGRPNDKSGQGSSLRTTLGYLLDIEHPLYPKRRYEPDGSKIRLAHVMPQLVATGHAPTKLIRTLSKFHNKERFELAVFSTERLVFRPQEYPYDIFCSAPSPVRAAEVIHELKDLGVSVIVDDAKQGFRLSAKQLAENLARWAADVVIFHGPDVINCCAARMCNAPYRVLFEHGSLPEHPGFDLVIASSEESIALFSDQFAKLGTDLKALPFCYDARSQWRDGPRLKSYWDMPETARILTTISNNLESRVHGDMCWTIAEILRRCPDAYYAPIGHIEDPAGFRERFTPYGVADRIRVIGSQPNPSHLARSMDIYLNEFPFGSGLACLDAMAAGCPLVSMHDPEGPPQARYGAVFMGPDRVVTSLKKEDYADLACKLLQDPETYKEWSTHACKRYEEQADAETYVKRLEQLILDGLHVRELPSHV